VKIGSLPNRGADHNDKFLDSCFAALGMGLLSVLDCVVLSTGIALLRSMANGRLS